MSPGTGDELRWRNPDADIVCFRGKRPESALGGTSNCGRNGRGSNGWGVGAVENPGFPLGRAMVTLRQIRIDDLSIARERRTA